MKFSAFWIPVVLLTACRSTAPPPDVPEPVPVPVPDEPAPDEPAPEPDEPEPEPEPEPDAPAPDDPIRTVLADMGVHYSSADSNLEVAGWVNMQQGLVEVFACAPEGKTHESVVVLDCVPSGLHAGLLAIGLQPGSPVEVGTDGTYTAPTGDAVAIRVHWTDADGSERSARAEEWVWNEAEQSPMKRGHWIFAGSFMQPVTGRPDETTYAANYVKSLVTTYHDATSILETSHPQGIDDTVYYANEHNVPPVGTPVTVVFSKSD